MSRKKTTKKVTNNTSVVVTHPSTPSLSLSHTHINTHTHTHSHTHSFFVLDSPAVSGEALFRTKCIGFVEKRLGPGVEFINILRAAFTHADTKSAKKTVK